MTTQNPQATAAPTQDSARAELPVPQQPDAHAEPTAVTYVGREEGHVQTSQANVTYKVDGVAVTTAHAVVPIRELAIGTIVNVAHRITRNGVEEVVVQTYATLSTRVSRAFKDGTGNTYKVDGYRVYAVRSLKVTDGVVEVQYVGKAIVDNKRPTVSSHQEAYATWIAISDIVKYSSAVKVTYPKAATAGTVVARELLA